jgi:hypothetical protein
MALAESDRDGDNGIEVPLPRFSLLLLSHAAVAIEPCHGRRGSAVGQHWWSEARRAGGREGPRAEEGIAAGGGATGIAEMGSTAGRRRRRGLAATGRRRGARRAAGGRGERGHRWVTGRRRGVRQTAGEVGTLGSVTALREEKGRATGRSDKELSQLMRREMGF